MAMRNPYASMNRGMNQYKQNNVMTASPQELTLMLYNGVIKFVHQAILHIEQKNVQKSHDAIMRSHEIISELMATLNMDYEVSKGLYSIYEFLLDQLIQANMKKDAKVLEEGVLPILVDLRDTWKQAMQLAKKES